MLRNKRRTCRWCRDGHAERHVQHFRYVVHGVFIGFQQAFPVRGASPAFTLYRNLYALSLFLLKLLRVRSIGIVNIFTIRSLSSRGGEIFVFANARVVTRRSVRGHLIVSTRKRIDRNRSSHNYYLPIFVALHRLLSTPLQLDQVPRKVYG